MALKQSFYVENRKKVGEQLENDSMAILFSGREIEKSLDENYPFFASNNFYYLTGIKEPDVVLLIVKTAAGLVREKLFIEEPDPVKEKWVGKKIDKEQAKAVSGIASIEYSKALAKEISDSVSFSRLYFDFKIPKHQSFKVKDKQVQKLLKQCELKDLHPILARMRMIKTPEEIEAIKKANALTKEGFKEMKQLIKPGIGEYELAAFFEYYIKKEGADGLAFESIVASGKNATTLHYVTNCSKLKSGDLVLFDLGARVNGYCGDISRTLAVNGEMTFIQERIVRIVEFVQKEMFLAYKPGAVMKDLQNLTKKLFLEKCCDAGIIPRNQDITEFYYHGIGHSLGLDTHDLRPDGDLVLEPGMVLTVEPGLYLEKLGIGVRIEDDVVITDNGCEVL